MVTVSQHIRLVELWEKCSSCAGFCIELGERFFHEAITEVNDTIIPLLQSKADRSISPRVIPSYAILLWFAQQVPMHVYWNIYIYVHNLVLYHSIDIVISYTCGLRF